MNDTTQVMEDLRQELQVEYLTLDVVIEQGGKEEST